MPSCRRVPENVFANFFSPRRMTGAAQGRVRFVPGCQRPTRLVCCLSLNRQFPPGAPQLPAHCSRVQRADGDAGAPAHRRAGPHAARQVRERQGCWSQLTALKCRAVGATYAYWLPALPAAPLPPVLLADGSCCAHLFVHPQICPATTCWWRNAWAAPAACCWPTQACASSSRTWTAPTGAQPLHPLHPPASNGGL